MKGRRLLAVVPVLLLLFCGGLVAQDDLADYPIKEEQCENFGCASPPPLYARRPNANRAAGAAGVRLQSHGRQAPPAVR